VEPVSLHTRIILQIHTLRKTFGNSGSSSAHLRRASSPQRVNRGVHFLPVNRVWQRANGGQLALNDLTGEKGTAGQGVAIISQN
jgi:hypothetical protein